MNQSCPQCNSDGGFCNFCGNKPVSEMTKKAITELGDKLAEMALKGVMKDPYEAQGKDFRVNHPTQPKTQVERWREEIEENKEWIRVHSKHINCGYDEGYWCSDCETRYDKIEQLETLISQATKPIHPRYPTGEFADDIENAPEYIKKSLFGYNFKKVTLLDKIKKLLQ